MKLPCWRIVSPVKITPSAIGVPHYKWALLSLVTIADGIVNLLGCGIITVSWQVDFRHSELIDFWP